MNDNITIDLEKEMKRRAFKEKISRKLQEGKDWLYRNKEYVISFTPVIIGGLTTVAKVVGKRANLRKEEDLKELYCYDRSLGHYWRLKRDLTNQEWLEIDLRKKNGERLSSILVDLNVLK